MTRTPTVSIVVNNYNYGRFVGDAIESALSQTYRYVEVIVVDDGSTDDSKRIMQGWGNRIRAVFKENGGQASALNAGFPIATGDLVMFLDSDDKLLNIAAETIAREWQSGGVRMQYPLEVMDASGMPLGRLVGGAIVPSSLVGPFGVGSPMSGNVFSRYVLEKIMPIPEEQWRICADSYLVAASSVFGDVKYLEQPLAWYRIHGNNKVACGDKGLKDLRTHMHNHFRLHKELSRLGGEKIGSLESWLGTHPQHWIGRITSLRGGPADHPWPDTLSGLVRRGIRATWRQPYWNPRRKLAYTIFILAYSILPQKIINGLRTVEGYAQTPILRNILGKARHRGASPAAQPRP